MGVTHNVFGGQLDLHVRGQGSTATDSTNWASAVTAINASAGGGRIHIEGSLRLNAAQTFTKPIQLIGVGTDAEILTNVTGIASLIQIGSFIDPPGLAPTFAITTTAGGEVINSAAQTINPGEYVIIWSEDQIIGVTPHYGKGAGQHPLEVHQCRQWDSINKNAYVASGFTVDAMTSGANAKGYILTMLEGCAVENLKFNHLAAGDPDNYHNLIAFYGCANPRVRNVQVKYLGSGALFFAFCTNVTMTETVIEGSKKLDDTYAVTVSAVNGGVLDYIARDTRHCFTTTSAEQVDSNQAVSSVDDSLDTLTFSAAHGINNGEHVYFTTTGTMPSPLIAQTSYWASSVTSTTMKLSTSPGGAEVDILTVGSGTLTMFRQGRWGTPMGITTRGVAYVGTEATTAGAETTRIGWSTHPEGYGITCEMDIYVSGRKGNTAAHSRSRKTTFKNMAIYGSGTGSKGIRLQASDNVVTGCTFRDLWFPVIIEDQTAGSGIVFSRCLVTHNTFANSRGPAVQASGAGVNHTIANNVFDNCARFAGTNPFVNKALIWLKDGSGHRVYGNTMPKESNDYSIYPWQLDETEFEMAGNICTGYGAGLLGIGQSIICTGNASTDILTAAAAHGFANNDIVRFTTTGTLPAPLVTATDYYVLVVDADEFQVEASIGGGFINLTDTGTGTHSVETAKRTAIEAAFLANNHTD